MLKLLEYNSERIVVVYTDCSPTLDKSRVQSIDFKTGSSDDCCDNTPVLITSFNQLESISLLSGESKIIEYYSFNQNKPSNYSLVVNITGTYNIQFSQIGNNIVEGNQILNDFKDTDLIIISNNTYKIDKTRSTKNKLVLFTPLTATSSSYTVPIVYKEILFPLDKFKTKAIDYITSIKGTCCSNDLDKGVDFATKFMALQQAIKCNNQEEASNLYLYLDTWD